MSDLVERLRAALDGDEQWAKAASFPEKGDSPLPGGAHWAWGVGENWDHYKPDPLEQFLGENAEDNSSIALVTAERRQLDWGGEGNTLPAVMVASGIEEIRTVDAAHIVRHDPARTLAMVAAHREILALHQIEQTPPAFNVYYGRTMWPFGRWRCSICSPWIDGEQQYHDGIGCPTVLALAKGHGIEED